MKKIIVAISGIFFSLCFTGTVYAYCEYLDMYGTHSWVETGYWEPSCETEGGYYAECEVCGTLYSYDLPSTGHDWHWIVEEDATCTEEGYGAVECLNCGERYYEPIQPTGHTWKYNGVIQQATCTQNGIEQERCVYCGETREEYTGKGSHVYGGWTVSKAATDNTMGTRTRKCSQCGNSYSESFYPDGTVLRGGSNDAALVKEIQQILINQKYLNDTADGVFGKNTEAAVKAFQTAHNLNADGIGWPQTLKAIRNAANGNKTNGISEIEVIDFYSDNQTYTLAQFREAVKDEDTICAVAYLGNYEAEYKDLAAYLEVADVNVTFPFMLEIPEERFFAYRGKQLYCIVPIDESASVSVSQWVFSKDNNYSGKDGEKIYDSNSGEPFYLMGNISEILPNLHVIVKDSTGKNVEFYPFMDMETNTLEQPNGGGILDITPYESKLFTEYLDINNEQV